MHSFTHSLTAWFSPDNWCEQVRFTDGNVSYDQTQQYQLIDAAGLDETILVTSVDIFPHSSSSLLDDDNNSFFTQRSLRAVIWSEEQPSLAAGTLWNTTDSSSFRFDTGAQDLAHVDEVQQWHGLGAGTCWATSAANELRGSMGRQWESKRYFDQREFHIVELALLCCNSRESDC